MSVLLETEVVCRGLTWYLVQAEYELEGVPMSFYFHALSGEHANEVLEAIANTARVTGHPIDFIDAGDQLRAPVTIN